MKKSRGITLVSLVITIIVLLILTGIGIVIISSDFEERQKDNNNKSNHQEICQHEWVVTSKYDFIWQSYKTISKCSKCGKEVE